MLRLPLPALKDEEGLCDIKGLPPVIDAHVHVFPDRLFESIRKWFDQYGWPIRYRLKASDVASYLFDRGVEHVVFLCYAHRPGVAEGLNRFMVDISRQNPGITALAAVFPGEDGAAEIIERAMDAGLAGVKLHAHVQCVPVDSHGIHEIAGVCEGLGKPLVFHAGREPRSPAYQCDPHVICSSDRVEALLNAHPGLKLCVPHLGMDEYSEYQRLIVEYDNLWLDTTMALGAYLPATPPPLSGYRVDRLMYGTDFPNIPYAWDRELRALEKMGLDEGSLSKILSENAKEFFSI